VFPGEWLVLLELWHSNDPFLSTSASGSAAGTAGGRATPEMKRSAVRSLIQRYFHQLQSGCGNAHCSNANCASSGKVAPMTPNEVAARALQLFSQDAQLCEPSTSAASRWESFTQKWVVPSRNQPVVLVR